MLDDADVVDGLAEDLVQGCAGRRRAGRVRCACSLSDAELEKIRPSRSSDVNSPVISASALLSLAQLFGHQLAGALLEQLTSRFLQMPVGASERVEMSAARRDRSRVGALKSHALLQMLAQQVDALRP